MSDLLQLTEVAQALRIGLRTVERKIANGEIRSVLIGRRRLVRQEELERLVRDAERRGRVA